MAAVPSTSWLASKHPSQSSMSPQKLGDCTTTAAVSSSRFARTVAAATQPASAGSSINVTAKSER